jgi:hypothetical protein
MRQLLSIICVFALVSGANAQHFRWKSMVKTVDTTDYVRVLLQPEVTTELHPGYPDIRLYDDSNKEVAYLIGKDRLIAGTTRFVEYPVVDKHMHPGDSWVTVENPLYKTDPLDQICLEVNNTEASRGMILVGSYDGTHWYAIKDEFQQSYYESNFHDSVKTTAVVKFDFPLTDYRYYRFEFDNWDSWWWHDYYYAPVFVVRAGVLVKSNPMSVPDQKMELPGVTYTAKQFGKTTAIDIEFSTPQYVDYMQLDLSAATGPGTFCRAAKLFVFDSTHVCDSSKLPPHFTATMLSKGGLNEFALGGMKVQHLCIHIENEDDQALNINGVHAIQIRQFLIAWLEKGKQYHIMYGADSTKAPRYDIRHNADDITVHEMNLIGTTGKEDLLGPAIAQIKEETFLENKTAIWTAIVIVVLILGWMSVKMLREMKSDN